MSLFPVAPFGSYLKEKFEVDARHRTLEYRLILLVEDVFDKRLGRKVRPMGFEAFFQRNIAHEIGRYPVDFGFGLVARCGETFAVMAPFVAQRPCFPV